MEIGSQTCEFQWGSWTWHRLVGLHADAGNRRDGQRLAYFSSALIGTPFMFESLRLIPPRGTLAVHLDALDCLTFVFTSLAFAAANRVEAIPEMLRSIRYQSSADGVIDSHPEYGNIFDFAEEALLIKAIELGLVRDVTLEVSGAAFTVQRRQHLQAIQRKASADRARLWATPKIQVRTIDSRLIAKANFRRLEEYGALQTGDILLLSKDETLLVGHLGIVQTEPEAAYLLHATRHFAWRPDADERTPGTYTRVFYDPMHKREQIGVGFTGIYCGDQIVWNHQGVDYRGYVPGTRRTMTDYLTENFAYVRILRPVLPARY
jgi:hypothetical protein